MNLETLMKELEMMKKKGVNMETPIVMKTLNTHGSFVAIDVNSISISKTVNDKPIDVIVLSNITKTTKPLHSKLLDKLLRR